MDIKTFIVDTFTDRPFSGNPAGVCIVDHPLENDIMQNIANELNHSETAFIWPNSENITYHIRYFTPSVEVDFCGHATLASSKVLLDHFGNKNVEFSKLEIGELELSEILEREMVKILLQPGELLVVNNRNAIHSRKSYQGERLLRRLVF